MAQGGGVDVGLSNEDDELNKIDTSVKLVELKLTHHSTRQKKKRLLSAGNTRNQKLGSSSFNVNKPTQ